MTEEKVCYEIRRAKNEELLEAAIHFWRSSYEGDNDLADMIEKWMRLGFALAQEDAWEKVAPAWLTDWRKHMEIPF